MPLEPPKAQRLGLIASAWSADKVSVTGPRSKVSTLCVSRKGNVRYRGEKGTEVVVPDLGRRFDGVWLHIAAVVAHRRSGVRGGVRGGVMRSRKGNDVRYLKSLHVPSAWLW